ncbi:YdgH/BhsA/McbA-like domain containing protein, partial [Escherichia coli]
AANLSELYDKLAEKAREQGSYGYCINAAGGNVQMFGTAIIYK